MQCHQEEQLQSLHQPLDPPALHQCRSAAIRVEGWQTSGCKTTCSMSAPNMSMTTHLAGQPLGEQRLRRAPGGRHGAALCEGGAHLRAHLWADDDYDDESELNHDQEGTLNELEQHYNRDNK